MRKVYFTAIFTTTFEPKGDRGDRVKQDTNRTLRDVLDSVPKITRYQIESSVRDYKRDTGSITTSFSAYIQDGVDMSAGEVDPVNDDIWRRVQEAQPEKTGRYSDEERPWFLDDISTDNIEHMTSTVDDEERIKVDLNDGPKYRDHEGAIPDFRQTRTLYPHEFEQAFEAIMDDLRESLKLDSANYKLSRSLLEEKSTEWNCEECGREEVELHHELVRSAVKSHFRERLSSLDGFVIDEETGEVFMESTTLTKHIAELVHNPDVLTPLCSECHHERH